MIAPRTTKDDAEFLQMPPDQRIRKLLGQGHAFPTEKQCSDQGVSDWFNSHPLLRERRRLANKLIRAGK